MRAQTLLQEGPELYAAWKHLPALIKEGQQNAIAREFGQPLFEYAAQHPSFGAVFNETMSSYSSIDTMLVLEALERYDFSEISHLCDVGGGHGHTLCSLLSKYPNLKGTVLELPSVRKHGAVLGRQDGRGRPVHLHARGHVLQGSPSRGLYGEASHS